MRLLSWNVNGIRAISEKADFFPWLEKSEASIIALQEVKAEPGQLSPTLLNPYSYLSYWCSSKQKKGYSGVALYSLTEPISISYELPNDKWAQEGRLIQAEYPHFYFFNVYFPNGQKDEVRLNYKLGYYDAFLAHANKLRKKKPIVVCGDFNTAHHPIDLARPKENEETSGFLPIERKWLDKLVSNGYVDTFRHIKGQEKDAYSWWSFRAGSRDKNIGWRIDYFFVSKELEGKIKNAWIEPKVKGSDHCPVGLELDVYP
ncbi:MAG: exodeoxyribonuclease III [Deltaproteobacteria bacterium]|jgi:exodeoxyribonuclease-3|nr:exodeoxyribonuclease III [Deltaproteobacteria bacterium]